MEDLGALFLTAANDPSIQDPLLSIDIEVKIEPTYVDHSKTIKSNEFDVESIYGIARARTDLTLRYRVHWSGFPRSQDTWEPLENFDSSLVESILSFHHISLEYCRILSFGAVVPRTTYLYISILQELEQTPTTFLRQMMELQAVNTSPSISVIPQSETAVGLIRMQDGVNVSTQTETSLTLDVSTQTLPQSLLYTRKKRSDAKDIPLKFICPYCDAKFGSKSILTRHVKILHLTASKNRVNTVLKQWKCTTCNKNYKTEKSLNSHNGNGKCKGIPKPRASKTGKLK